MCLPFLITKNKLLETQLPQFWLRDLAVLPIHSLTKFSQHPVNKRGREKRKSICVNIWKPKVITRKGELTKQWAQISPSALSKLRTKGQNVLLSHTHSWVKAQLGAPRRLSKGASSGKYYLSHQARQGYVQHTHGSQHQVFYLEKGALRNIHSLGYLCPFLVILKWPSLLPYMSF